MFINKLSIYQNDPITQNNQLTERGIYEKIFNAFVIKLNDVTR